MSYEKKVKEFPEKVVVTQIRGVSGRPQRQRDTLKALGLGKIGRQAEHTVNPAILGMVRSVRHLVDLEPAE